MRARFSSAFHPVCHDLCLHIPFNAAHRLIHRNALYVRGFPSDWNLSFCGLFSCTQVVSRTQDNGAGGGDSTACSPQRPLIASLFVNSQLMDNLQCCLTSSEFWDMFVQSWPLFIHSVLVYVLATSWLTSGVHVVFLDLLAETKEEDHARCYIMFFCCSDCLQGSSSENRRIFEIGRHHSGFIKGIITLQPERFSHFY